MTRTELETEYTRLVSMEGWSNSPSPSSPTSRVNEAWRLFSVDAELIIGTEQKNSSNGVGEYQFSTIKRIQWVSYNANPLWPTSEAYEQFLNPAWRTTTGTPVYFAVSNEQTVTLIPVPTAAQPIRVRGPIEGSDMSAGTDQPGQVGGTGVPILKHLHYAIALKAAVLEGQAYMQGASSQRMKDLDDEYMTYVLRAKGGGSQ